MKFQCNLKKLDPQYGQDGKKILALMQDKETNSVDLLLREIIQNSSDAISYDKNFGIIKFKSGTFNSQNLFDTLDQDDGKIQFGKLLHQKIKNQNTCRFLSITDTNTTGLCGTFHKDKNLRSNNLYSLVYDVLDDNKSKIIGTGGSHGIGKTVYYRFGKQLVFYYSRTKEIDGRINSKLAGLYFEDIESPSAILRDSSNGIALFGQNTQYEGSPVSEPIYDEKQIKEFLDIFGLPEYDSNHFGTVILIPFIDFNDFHLDENRDFDNQLKQKLSILCQRWYFPLIDNEDFKGKYLKIWINDSRLELNGFFKKLQELYNGKCEGEKTLDILPKKAYIIGKYGTFNYKVFSEKELCINQAPENLPSPYIQLDIQDQEGEPILFYARKPGMVLNYQFNKEIGIQPELKDGEYLIGVFVVNNDCYDNNSKTLDEYFKNSEKDSHKSWSDSAEITFSGCKPFKSIKREIKKHLKEEFEGDKFEDFEEGTNIRLQKELGNLLIAPVGYGIDSDSSTNERKKNRNHRGGDKFYCEFVGFTKVNSLPTYEITENFSPLEESRLLFEIKAESKSYEISEWLQDGFKSPIGIDSIDLIEFGENGEKLYHPNCQLQFNNNEAVINDPAIGEVIKVSIILNNHIPTGIKIKNICSKGATITFRLCIEPLTQEYQIKLSNYFEEDK